MTGIGNNFQVASLSNCFVIGHKHPADSYGGIFRMDEEQVQLMKRRGGVGHDLSHIRPTGSPVLNSRAHLDGYRAFHGALFQLDARGGAGRPARCADALAVDQAPRCRAFHRRQGRHGQGDGRQRFDQDRRRVHACRHRRQEIPPAIPDQFGQPDDTSRISTPAKLWDKIIHNAWKSAEPGVLFWDTIIRESRSRLLRRRGLRDGLDQPLRRNPALPLRFSCRLLAINLYSYVDNPFTKEAKFDFGKFRSHVAARPCA